MGNAKMLCCNMSTVLLKCKLKEYSLLFASNFCNSNMNVILVPS